MDKGSAERAKERHLSTTLLKDRELLLLFEMILTGSLLYTPQSIRM